MGLRPPFLKVMMINKKKRILELSGTVDNDMYKKVVHACHIFAPTARLKVYLNTPGGYVTCGLGIYDLLRLHFPKLTIISVGCVMSAGSIILCAGDKKLSLPNTEFMIHYGENSSESSGEARANVRTINQMKDIFKQHTKANNKIINGWFEKEAYFSAKQALKVGLINEIIGDNR